MTRTIAAIAHAALESYVLYMQDRPLRTARSWKGRWDRERKWERVWRMGKINRVEFGIRSR